MRTSVYNVLVMLSIIGAGNGWGATGGVVQNPWIWEEGNSIHRNRGVTQAELVRLTVNQKDDSAGRGQAWGLSLESHRNRRNTFASVCVDVYPKHGGPECDWVAYSGPSPLRGETVVTDWSVYSQKEHSEFQNLMEAMWESETWFRPEGGAGLSVDRFAGGKILRVVASVKPDGIIGRLLEWRDGREVMDTPWVTPIRQVVGVASRVYPCGNLGINGVIRVGCDSNLALVGDGLGVEVTSMVVGRSFFLTLNWGEGEVPRLGAVAVEAVGPGGSETVWSGGLETDGLGDGGAIVTKLGIVSDLLSEGGDKKKEKVLIK